MKLEQILNKKIESELRFAKEILESNEDIDLYEDIYIQKRQYVLDNYQNFSDDFKNYLSLYLTNESYFLNKNLMK